MQIVELLSQNATPETFAPYGQVIQATDDMQHFGPHDAQLDLSQGIPRFYMIRVQGGKLGFGQITYHEKVTQCLAAASEHVWYLGVAPSSAKPAPKVEDVVAFRIPPKTIIKLNRGTWHAGPLFAGHSVLEFYNLELSDTNQVDHHNHFFETEGIEFLIHEESSV